MKNKTFLAIAVASLVATTAGILMAIRKKRQQNGTPPKAAPQLHISNPGDQSEFPSAPEGERDLG
jgi:hypothetical protein